MPMIPATKPPLSHKCVMIFHDLSFLIVALPYVQSRELGRITHAVKFGQVDTLCSFPRVLLRCSRVPSPVVLANERFLEMKK